jgi:hypothetical protein
MATNNKAGAAGRAAALPADIETGAVVILQIEALRKRMEAVVAVHAELHGQREQLEKEVEFLRWRVQP